MAIYDYENRTAFNPETGEGTPNAVGQVFAKTDTTFSTPLVVTLMGSGLTVTDLTTDQYCQLQGFQAADLVQVVFKSGDFTKVLNTTTPLVGPAGPAVTEAVDNGDNTVTFLLEDGSPAATVVLPASDIPGPPGDKGEPGDQGLPGVNAVPADEAVGTYATTPGTATHTAINATIASEVGPLETTVTELETSVAKYDPKRFLYASDTALMKWRSALARARGAGFARINVYGDSVTHNTSTSGTPSPKYLNSYTQRVKALLDKEYGDAGTGVVFPIKETWPDDNRFAVAFPSATSGFAVTAAFGPYSATARTSSPAVGADWIDFTADCDTFTFYYFKNTGYGTFNYSVDGGVVQSHSADGTIGVGSLTIPAGARGTHKLRIAVNTGSTWFLAVEGSIGATGVRVTKCARQSMKSSDLVGNSTHAFGSLLTSFNPLYKADLNVIFMGINDYFQSITKAAYKANMTTLIDRAKTVGGDVLLIAPYDLGANVPSYPQQDYLDALYELADEKDCALLDMYRRWPEATLAKAEPYMLLSSDEVHLKDIGTYELANALHAAIR